MCIKLVQVRYKHAIMHRVSLRLSIGDAFNAKIELQSFPAKPVPINEQESVTYGISLKFCAETGSNHHASPFAKFVILKHDL